MKPYKLIHQKSFLWLLLLATFACAESKVEDSTAKTAKPEKIPTQAPESKSSAENTTISSEKWLDWLPISHAGFTREQNPSMDYGDLPRTQVLYVHDKDPEKQFTLDVLDGKRELKLAVTAMINAKLAKNYQEKLLDGYVKVYQNYGVTAFERHTPADRKAYLEYAIDDRFYFNYQGENVSPEVFWEFFQVLDPKKLAP
ncbi:hypothetical protein [Algoriphagus namhaensis]